ncbi:hypothetical protein [Kitasatospora sp. CB01950]|uniref:hypothetical protein n=1 Tax=Kitasatospora sp. CB01950 TaxID=1703930 RepID=UPI00093FF347|nr:hypothetical protein [Kitasatospora sp. CB01950]OKJ13917.1 hypothetical protein AMK19_11165 [Kitasatospora sp. CB01950]
MSHTDRAARTSWSVQDGLATLGGPATGLLRALDDVFTGWATARGAEPMTLPPLLPAAELRKLDYFQNFPHLGSTVSRIRPDRLDQDSAKAGADPVPAHDLADATHLLPSAACYGAFLHLADSSLDRDAALVTTVAHCYRNEDHHDGLRRLWGFTMREIVCLGSQDAVRAHLDHHRTEVAAFADRLGIELHRAPASDPFFRRDSPRAVLQVLAPVKEEFLAPDGTAVASLNNHRNFFGERCAIRHDGRPAFTGCVAFGLERWLHVLDLRFDGDLAAARDAVVEAGAPQ